MSTVPYTGLTPPQQGGYGGGGQQQQQQQHSGSGGSGSVTPLVVVLVVIGVLGIAAAVVGRLCATRRFRVSGEHDLEEWIEQRCASCIDGRLECGAAPSAPPPPPVAKPADNVEPSKPASEAAG